MSYCGICNRPDGEPDHILGVCDMARLSDGRVVHVSRLDVGGDLHDQIGDELNVLTRYITPEMRKQAEKRRSRV
jgi:hypothetical protein